MDEQEDYLRLNRASWNRRTLVHTDSSFYAVDRFLAGESSLRQPELALLGSLTGKSLLHLQCHFGQDSISLARMGARVTGIDLSDVAIDYARALTVKAGAEVAFYCCDVYSVPEQVPGRFDIVFSSYGVIGWLPDLDRWAAVVAGALKPGGRFVFAEFHPFVWMFDDDFERIAYDYFNTGPLLEMGTETYADPKVALDLREVNWNHGIAEVLSALMKNGLVLESFDEYDYSPFDCFRHAREEEPGKFRIGKLGKRIPMVYALSARK